MKIEIFGSGCPTCKVLEERAKEAVRIAGLKATVEHVYDIEKIAEMGIFSVPSLSIDGELIVEGRLASVDELVELLKAKKG